MSLSTLGKRYERLLFFSAPITLASIVVLFVVFATASQAERTQARCYGSAASLLESKSEELHELWKNYNAINNSIAKIDYTYGIKRNLIDTRLGRTCWDITTEKVDPWANNGIDDLIKKFRSESERLATTPVKYPGVELPEKATLSLLGTKVAIDITLFASLLQAILAPILLLWLGSLYNTRYRESILIGKARTITEAFPHVINIYPSLKYPEPRKRNYLAPYLPYFYAAYYAAMRIGLLTTFIGPAVGSYITSIALSEDGPYTAILYALASIVGFFTLTLIICETFPWHYGKTFPGLPISQRKD